MFEKESLVYGIVNLPDGYTKVDYQKAENWRKGAEFGYNLAKEEIDYLNKHCGNGKDKANEWHYVKDGDLPKPTTPVLVILESGVPYVSWISSDKGWWFCTNYYTGEDKVIAWKEIVLPELKESE